MIFSIKIRISILARIAISIYHRLEMALGQSCGKVMYTRKNVVSSFAESVWHTVGDLMVQHCAHAFS